MSVEQPSSPSGGPPEEPSIKLVTDEVFERRLAWRRMRSGALKVLFSASAVITVGVSAMTLGILSKNAVVGLIQEGYSTLENAIIGSGMTVGMATAVSVPLGMLAGIYMSEAGDRTAYARLGLRCMSTSSAMSTLMQSILLFELMVVPMGGESALAGAAAYVPIATPIIAITTCKALDQLPKALEDTARSLGLPDDLITRKKLLAAWPAIFTGILLAISRIAGEAAPEKFTNGDNPFVSTDIREPVATLPTTILNFAEGPDPAQHRQAWVALGMLVTFSLLLNAIPPLMTKIFGRNSSDYPKRPSRALTITKNGLKKLRRSRMFGP